MPLLRRQSRRTDDSGASPSFPTTFLQEIVPTHPSIRRALLPICVSSCLAAGATHAATLIHHYDFSEGVVDLVGTEDGVLLGDAAVVSGRLNVDGEGDYAQFASHIVPTSGAYSVAFFAERRVDQARFTEVISQGFSGGPGFYMGTNPAGRIRVTDSWPTTNVPFGAPGVPMHYALVVDATAETSTLYVDGVIAATLGSAIVTTRAGTHTRLGRQMDSHLEYFDGWVDEVRIYDGALTASEVSALAAPVPEPGPMVSMAGGLVALGCFRSRTRLGKRTDSA